MNFCLVEDALFLHIFKDISMKNQYFQKNLIRPSNKAQRDL